jgi:O-antigen/teichoic acid export membrane protein
MSDGLKTTTLHALFWSFFERVGQQGIQFIISIILARLLLPEEFGLIAMLAIFMAVAQSFLDSGFGSALIQKKNAAHIDECSIFYFNIFVGFVAAGLLCMAAPWIAGFYNQPLLVRLTCVLSLNLIINAFGLVQTTLLTKHIDFKTQLKVSVIATVISGIIGVTMLWSLEFGGTIPEQQSFSNHSLVGFQHLAAFAGFQLCFLAKYVCLWLASPRFRIACYCFPEYLSRGDRQTFFSG